MLKHKNRIIGVITILLVIVCLAFIPEIYAEEGKKEQPAVTEESLDCQDLAKRYGLYMTPGDNEEEYVVIKDPKISCGGSVQTDVSFQITHINGAGAGDQSATLTKSNAKVTLKGVKQLKAPDGIKHYVTVTLQNVDNANEQLTIEYAVEKEEAVKGDVGQLNDHYYTICAALKTNVYNQYGQTGLDFYHQALPYCWLEKVAFNYTEDELNKKIDTVSKLYAAYITQNQSQNTDFDAVFKDIYDKAHKNPAVNVIAKPGDTTVTLKCDYDKISTGSNEPKTYTNEYGDSISSLEYYLNKDYYYSSETTQDGVVKYTYNFAPGNTVTDTQTACERTCEEAVKVEYGPPVASKAGLCFEYKIKVTSYVKCTSKVIADPPKQFTNYCNPAPICYSASGVLRTLEQAGPKEDFERCVQACDGGKYTESCSLQCYNKVYGKKSTKLAVDYETARIERLATTTQADGYSLAQCLADNESSGFGCYTYVAGDEPTINWYSLKSYNVDGTSKGTAWNDKLALGRWYIDRVYKKDGNVYNFEQPDYNRNIITGKGYDISGIRTTSCLTSNSPYCGKYVSDEMGIYRRNYSGSLCTDTCWWRTDVCKVSKDSVEGNEYMNPGTIEKDAKANQTAYEEAAAACIASATCSEHTAEFSISLNYDTETGEKIKVNTITFPYESTSDKLNANKVNNVADRSRSTILQYGGCYEDHQKFTNYYMTEWSFPGTYIHNKTGEISFKRPDVTDGWYYDDKKFCMPLDAESVNTKWWEWAKLGNTCYTDAQIKDELKGKTGTSNGYNITGRAKKFGYFGWNFDIKCFYALRNEICNIEDNGCCGTNKKEANGVSNYTFRSIALDNMFPNAAQEGVVDPDKRQIGFNWTSKAMSLKNGAYEVNPTALINHIESTASTLHSSEATELDYKFYLTPASLAKIKSYNNNHDYASWDGTVEEKNGINVYKSNLFRNVGSGTKVLTDIGGAVIKVGEPGVNNENYIAYGG